MTTATVVILHGSNHAHNRGLRQLSTLIQSTGRSSYIQSAGNLGDEIDRRLPFRPFWVRVVLSLALKSTANCPTWLQPLNIFWSIQAYAAIKFMGATSVWCRETPCALPVLIACWMAKVPFFLDIRELLPSNLVRRGNSAPRAVARGIYERYECFVMNRSQGVMFTTEKLKEYYREKGVKGSDAKKLSVVSNVPRLAELRTTVEALTQKFAAETLAHEKFETRFVFAGNLVFDRRCDMLIRAFKLCQHDSNSKLVFLGDGPALPSLISLSNSLDLSSSVEFRGRVAAHELLDVLQQFHVGLLSYEENELASYTLPGKLFEYMFAGLAVVSTPRPTTDAIIQGNGIGYVSAENSMSSLADTIRTVSLMPRSKLFELRKNSVIAVKEKFNQDKALEVFGEFFG